MTTSELAPLAIVTPIVTALLVLATSPMRGRRPADVLALLGASITAVIGAVLVARTGGGTVLHWFGGWTPRGGTAIGIALAVDRLGAGIATLAAVLTVAAVLVNWRYFEKVQVQLHSLLLLFLAAMVGFALTGDLFNLFVFFELMSVSAYGLTAYKAEEDAALQGAFNFAISNSLGAFLVLTGIGLLYARTGTLNLAQIGERLTGAPATGVVVMACVLVTAGFLVKSAAVPFHFWLADAHAVAPTPVCLLLSGVMVPIGLFGVARTTWTMFSGAIELSALRPVLIGAGLLTAVVGAVMCAVQHHLKRMLAFSTISHAGILLVAIGVLDGRALGGAAIYTLGHGLVKAALFVCTAILVHRFGAVRETRLFGRGRALPVTAAVWFVGGLALAGMPPFATALGKGLVDEALAKHHLHLVAVVLAGASALTGAAVLRVGAIVFLGRGTPLEDESSAEAGDEEQSETAEHQPRTPLSMLVPAVALVAFALVLGVAPGLARRADDAAARFTDVPARRAEVLALPAPAPTAAEAAPTAGPTASAAAAGLATTAMAIAGAVALGRRRRSWDGAVVDALRRIHTGHVGDLAAWLTFGVAAFGVSLAALTR